MRTLATSFDGGEADRLVGLRCRPGGFVVCSCIDVERSVVHKLFLLLAYANDGWSRDSNQRREPVQPKWLRTAVGGREDNHHNEAQYFVFY